MNAGNTAPISGSPYRGIHPFRYRDRALFFGREEPVAALLVKVLLSRLTILFGESGTGKSSLLNAGLVPALKKEGLQAERLLIHPDGPITVVRLGGDTPGSFLPSIFATNAADGPSMLARIPYDLERFARTVRASTGDAYPVLIFDQFEQLFTLFDRNAQQTQMAILGTIFEIINDATLRAKVIITMREDFLAKLEVLGKEYPRVFDNRVRLEQLDAQSALEAILKPFRPPNPFRSRLTEHLAGTVVADLAKESATGLIHPTHLQIVCNRLWNEYANTRSEIGKDEYESLGRVPGIISGYLESELGGLDAPRRAQAVWCLGGLITESGTRDVVSGGKLRDLLVKSGEMEGSALSAALDFLQEQRLINATPRRETLYYEIASEYLIPPVRRELQLLRLEEERQGLARKEREETDRRLTEAKLREGVRYQRLSRRLAGAVGAATLAVMVAAMGWGKAEFAWRREAEQTTLARNAEKQAHDARMDADDARRRETAALEAKLALEKETRRAREKEEWRALTDGQIERLRKEGENWPKSQRELVLDSVANLLWNKGKDQELERVLKGADDLFPDRYGVDEAALSNVLFVGDDTGWPLELHYSRQSEVDLWLLRYHWQAMAATLATSWGVPVPSRIKLIEDNALPTHQLRLVARSSEEDAKRVPPEARFSVRSEPDQVVVEDPGTDPENQRLSKFLKEYGQGKVKLSSDRIRRTYYFVPRWTQPVWKVAGHGSFSREGLIALSAASVMLEDPKLLITSESVRPILKRIAGRRPKTVEEALAARGGLAGLTADLKEIVRREVGLVHVEFLLDLLADFPGVSSFEAVDLALKTKDRLPDGLPATLPGHRGRGEHRLAAALESKAPYQHVYDEVSVWLPPLEQPIRVLMGSGVEKRLIRGNELAPEVLEALTDLRSKINRRFGFVPPSVTFRSEKQLRENEFRIEILNQTNRDPDAKPIATTPDRVLATLIGQLEFRYIAGRAWWMDSDSVNRRLLWDVPDHLRTWLAKRYTQTDLKLLLQAQIAPTARELDAYEEGRDEAGYGMIRDDGTIQDLSWLLGSLAFWASTGAETTDIAATVGWLRRVQGARLEASAKTRGEAETWELIQKGIDRLASGDIDGASGNFRAAVAADRRGAGEAFLALYAEKVRPEAQIARLERKCTLPRVGRVAGATPPSVSTRYELEEFLTRSSMILAEDRRRPLELCLLWIYADARHVRSAQAVIARLVWEDAQRWRPEEGYVFAGLMLRLHGESMAEPSQLVHIGRLLSDSVRRLPTSEAEAVFRELLDKYDRQLPLWHTKLLLSLAELQPTSFVIAYELGRRLTFGKSLEEAEAALKLLRRAEDRIVAQEPDQRDRLAAWISYFRGGAWLTSLQFGNRSAYAEIQKLATVINTREEREWPSRDHVADLLINAHLYADELAEATKASEEWVRRSPASRMAREKAIFVRWANLDVAGALRLARREKAEGDESNEEIAFKIAVLELLSGRGDFEASAKHFLAKTKHQYREYIRLMLFWRLGLEGRGHEARRLLSERWAQVNPASWKERLGEGDIEVWREMLVGYYVGEVSRQQMFGAVAKPGAFRDSAFSSIGMSFTELRGEAYFYDALLQEVSGERATRSSRSRGALEEVVKLRRLALYEYHMARYLLSVRRPSG